MAEAPNLELAAQYVNNLLLARGLLRDGEPLALANPKTAKGGTTGAMAAIMNVIHDLVLRRDVSLNRPRLTIPTFIPFPWRFRCNQRVQTFQEIVLAQTC
jgi:hypothetical protein